MRMQTIIFAIRWLRYLILSTPTCVKTFIFSTLFAFHCRTITYYLRTTISTSDVLSEAITQYLPWPWHKTASILCTFCLSVMRAVFAGMPEITLWCYRSQQRSCFHDGRGYVNNCLRFRVEFRLVLHRDRRKDFFSLSISILFSILFSPF